MPDRNLANALASVFLSGKCTVDALVDRVVRALRLTKRPAWLAPLAKRYADTFGEAGRPGRMDVLDFLAQDRGLRRARLKVSILRLIAATPPPRMWPVAAAANWRVPAIETVDALGDWLALGPGDLDWFADLHGWNRQPGSAQLSHYRYRVLAKGGGRVRLLEAPKRTLKLVQRQILRRILEPIPPHACAHGFVRGRSIQTFVAPHVGRRVVLRMDLQDFFPAIGRGRVQAVFRTSGYPEPVAALLGGICTNVAPRHAWGSDYPPPGVDPRQFIDARRLYARPHLPQGAPTSPALANLCAWRIDCRLAGLAAAAGARYSRYADDLAFSGDGADFGRGVERFASHVAAIVSEEGFEVNHRKTRIMRQGARQHLAGLVTNERANVARPEFDRLKAILTNCVRMGLESQNRAGHQAFYAHLNGRVGFFEAINPAKGQRLRAIFERITPC